MYIMDQIIKCEIECGFSLLYDVILDTKKVKFNSGNTKEIKIKKSKGMKENQRFILL